VSRVYESPKPTNYVTAKMPIGMGMQLSLLKGCNFSSTSEKTGLWQNLPALKRSMPRNVYIAILTV